MKLTSLTFLSLKNNHLTGSIPDDIGLMTKMKRLDLSHNSLTGSIPSSVSKMLLLTQLSFEHNSVMGSCPPFVVICNGIHRRVNGSAMQSSYDTSTGPTSSRISRALISTSTETALCAFIAATNVGSLYPVWQCTALHTVVSEPCGGSTSWPGVASCNSAGDVTGIAFDNVGLSGK